jgi:hypothetical protein
LHNIISGTSMVAFLAGFGLSNITPKVGCQLVGYSNRKTGATGVHDVLMARALVLESEGERWAVVSNDICYLNARTVKETREAVRQRTEIPPSHIFVAATHTHSGPHDRDSENWDRPLADIIADAVVQACNMLKPAHVGGAFGTLHGYSINRRWLDRPVDPGVGVIRIDDLEGKTLGLVTNFGCHGVVLGYDNYLVSSDWPGIACRYLEDALGPQSVCLFLQGGSGDTNPLVDGVRKHLQSGHAVVSIGDIYSYHGGPDDPDRWNIGDRGGGTFEEARELGKAFADEALRVARGIVPRPVEKGPWSEQFFIDAAKAPDEPKPDIPFPSHLRERPQITIEDGKIHAEIMAIGIDRIVIVGEPGEILSQTAVALRTRLRVMGFDTPLVVSYANGWMAYLPDSAAFDEGGYETSWPNYLGVSRYFQDRVWDRVEPELRKRVRIGS